MSLNYSHWRNCLLFITPPSLQHLHSVIWKHQILPPDGVFMTNIFKGCRYCGNILVIINKNHVPNWYYSYYLSEGNICKLSGCDSPWSTIYHSLDLSTAITSRPKEKINVPLCHKENSQYNKTVYTIIRDKISRKEKAKKWGGLCRPIKKRKYWYTAIVCCLWQLDGKSPPTFCAVLGEKSKLNMITWFY